jgi:hypothetical protein
MPKTSFRKNSDSPLYQSTLRLSRTKNLHFAKATFPGFSALVSLIILLVMLRLVLYMLSSLYAAAQRMAGGNTCGLQAMMLKCPLYQSTG